MASYRGTLYTGVTNDLARRAHEHRHSEGSRFTAKYNIHKLVYFETTTDIRSALEREKQVKGWRREKRVELIESMNPYWDDLAAEWYVPPATPDPSLRSG